MDTQLLILLNITQNPRLRSSGLEATRSHSLSPRRSGHMFRQPAWRPRTRDKHPLRSISLCPSSRHPRANPPSRSTTQAVLALHRIAVHSGISLPPLRFFLSLCLVRFLSLKGVGEVKPPRDSAATTGKAKYVHCGRRPVLDFARKKPIRHTAPAISEYFRSIQESGLCKRRLFNK